MNAITAGHEVFIELRDAQLPGHLCVPDHAHGLVVFAHGSGSSRFSPRNNRVAEYLHTRGLGTLLFDLLTATEGEVDQLTRHHRFDIPLLSSRLGGAIQWLRQQRETRYLNIGLFGSSTGAAAAIIAAVENADQIDDRAGSRTGIAIEDVAAHMTVVQKRVGSAGQKHRGMHVDDRFLCDHRADAEHVAHHHLG